MRLFDWLFGKKKVPTTLAIGLSHRTETPPSNRQSLEKPRTASRGVATIIDVCSRNDLLGDTLLNQGISELKSEGTRGAQALAGLIRELLAARSSQIGNALWAASKLAPVPDLIGVLQDVLSAQPLTQKQSVTRFAPEIVGEGRIGWTDGTASRVRELARDALKAFGVQPKHDPDELLKQSVSDAGRVITAEEKKLTELITNMGLGKEHAYNVEEYAAKMGEKAIPIIARLMERDLNGRTAWAAAYALRRINLPSALPMIALALKSSYAGTHSTGVWYLLAYPSAEGKEIARKHIPNEKDPKSRELLEGLIKNP